MHELWRICQYSPPTNDDADGHAAQQHDGAVSRSFPLAAVISDQQCTNTSAAHFQFCGPLNADRFFRSLRLVTSSLDRRRYDALGEHMKLIIAIIQPSKLEAVKEALAQVEVFRLTVMDVQGFGRQKGHTEIYRGREFTVNLLRKVEIQVAVNDDFLEKTINAILEAGRSGDQGKVGDGKIFVVPIEDCIRIRTGERGPEAI